ncbi:MAG: diguanylate cyclase [Armatimonadetes bacterium]|nr:diguanylate cyclase [Armatimonadota bacterium]
MRLVSQCWPLGVKVFFVCVASAFVVSFIATAVLYHGAGHSLRQQLRDHLKAGASLITLEVDPVLHEKIRTRADQASDSYRIIQKRLRAVRRAYSGIRNVYTMRKTDKKNTWQFVVDTDGGTDTPVGLEYDVSELPEMQKAFDGPAADMEPATDRWGTWLSGYAPIRDAKGRAVAILGIDVSLAHLKLEESNLREAALLTFIYGFVLAVIASLLITRVLLNKVQVFSRAAERVRAGDLDFQLPAAGSPEIRKFTEAFNSMVGGLKINRDSLMEQATRDMLTGLYNHVYFQERLTSEIENAAKYGQTLCLLVLDIDHFKGFNDAWGYSIGARVIRQMADLLRSCVGPGDILARYGGDEFALILPDTDIETGRAVADKLRRAIERQQFRTALMDEVLPGDSVPDDRQVSGVTVTIGLVGYPDNQRSRDGLVMAAEIALCRGKHQSRNSVCVYDAMTDQADDELDLNELYQVLHDPNAAAIKSLAAAVDAKDPYTCGHSERVARYAVMMGEVLQESAETIDTLKVAGLLHDLGKIGVPDSILRKAGRLTDEEFDTVKQHPSVGGNILRRAPQLDVIIPAVISHHERWDGAGYPHGLRGSSIARMARILAVADAFDAMTSDRPYRKAMPLEQALNELRKNAGVQFDPEIVEAFLIAISSQGQALAA